MKSLFFALIVYIVLFTSCANPPQYNDPIPTHDSLSIMSVALNENRVINVWTPDTYKNSTDSFPVLYMPDGGVKEDFPHIANSLAQLIASKKIKPIILVGIENTERRRDLSGPTTIAKDKEIAPIVGGAENFRKFINDELFVEINKKYRTNNTKGIIGESLAGLFVTETFLLYPDMFDFYIAFDPSLWWNDQLLIKTAKDHLSKFPDSQKTFWFAGSSAEDISENVAKLAEAITTTNVPNVKWQYSNETNEKHNTIFRATKEKALIWTLQAHD